MARQFGVILPGAEIQDLEDFKCYIRTLTTDQPSGPHLVQTFQPFDRTGAENDAETLTRTSLQRYGRPRSEVESRLNR